MQSQAKCIQIEQKYIIHTENCIVRILEDHEFTTVDIVLIVLQNEQKKHQHDLIYLRALPIT